MPRGTRFRIKPDMIGKDVATVSAQGGPPRHRRGNVSAIPIRESITHVVGRSPDRPTFSIVELSFAHVARSGDRATTTSEAHVVGRSPDRPTFPIVESSSAHVARSGDRATTTMDFLTPDRRSLSWSYGSQTVGKDSNCVQGRLDLTCRSPNHGNRARIDGSLPMESNRFAGLLS